MFLLDTNVLSESRKGHKANKNVQTFFAEVMNQQKSIYISAISIGELRRGIEKLRHKNDKQQADRLEIWLENVLNNYNENILPFDADIAQVWGRLRVPHYENAIDKQIAATALVYDLTVVTRNISDFKHCGVALLNPFLDEPQ